MLLIVDVPRARKFSNIAVNSRLCDGLHSLIAMTVYSSIKSAVCATMRMPQFHDTEAILTD
jgi:hypothetical protein